MFLRSLSTSTAQRKKKKVWSEEKRKKNAMSLFSALSVSAHTRTTQNIRSERHTVFSAAAQTPFQHRFERREEQEKKKKKEVKKKKLKGERSGDAMGPKTQRMGLEVRHQANRRVAVSGRGRGRRQGRREAVATRTLHFLSSARKFCNPFMCFGMVAC